MKNLQKTCKYQKKCFSLQRQNVCFDYAAECGEQGLIDTAPFKATMGGFYFSYFFLNKRLNLGASTCHLETDIDFLPLKNKTSIACSLASKYAFISDDNKRAL